jgi:hypothetical protein
MTVYALLLAAAIVNAPSPTAASADKIRILIVTKPAIAPARNVSALTEAKVISKLATEIQKLFPCATVVTKKELDMQVKPSLDVELHSRGDAWWDAIAQALDADLFFNIELGVSGPPDPLEHYMNTTVVDPRTAQIPHRNVASAPGASWAADDLVAQEIAELRGKAMDVCPWLGTIDYSRTVAKDSVVKVTTSNQVETTTDNDHSTDNWTITLDRVRMGPVFKTSKGKSVSDTKYDMTQVMSDVTCFKMIDGVVRDDHQVSHVDRTVIVHKEFKGVAADSLMGMDFKLIPADPASTNTTWTLSVMAGAVGPPNQKGQDYEQLKGGCGENLTDKWQDPLHMPLIVAILFGVTDIKATSDVMADSRTLPAVPFTIEKVTWKLHRD